MFQSKKTKAMHGVLHAMYITCVQTWHAKYGHEHRFMWASKQLPRIISECAIYLSIIL